MQLWWTWGTFMCWKGNCFAGWVLSQIGIPAQVLVQISRVLFSLKREMESGSKTRWPGQLSFLLILSLLYSQIAFFKERSLNVIFLCINTWKMFLYWNAWSTKGILSLGFLFVSLCCILGYFLSLTFLREIKGQKLKTEEHV